VFFSHCYYFSYNLKAINLVSNPTEWILDTGATRHFCANKDLMYDFEEVPDGEHVFMGNAAAAESWVRKQNGSNAC